MTRRYLACTAAVGALATIVAAGALSADGHRLDRGRSSLEPSPIEALDQCVQYRLHDDVEVFGFSRLADVPHRLYHFDPRTPDEASAVDGLRKTGRHVVLHLGGRGLVDQAGKADGEKPGRRTFSEAIAVTGGGVAPRDLPDARLLRALGRKALAASTAGEPVVERTGRWRVDVRPVRADRQACVDCHAPRSTNRGGRPLQIGDALGVVVYVSSRAEL
jgi:hypothetical protein